MQISGRYSFGVVFAGEEENPSPDFHYFGFFPSHLGFHLDYNLVKRGKVV